MIIYYRNLYLQLHKVFQDKSQAKRRQWRKHHMHQVILMTGGLQTKKHSVIAQWRASSSWLWHFPKHLFYCADGPTSAVKVQLFHRRGIVAATAGAQQTSAVKVQLFHRRGIVAATTSGAQQTSGVKLQLLSSARTSRVGDVGSAANVLCLKFIILKKL